MGTLKAEAVVDRAGVDPDSHAAAGEDQRGDAQAQAPDATSAGSAPEDSAAPQEDAKGGSIRRSIVALLQPSVSAANDDRVFADDARARSASSTLKLKYAALLCAAALLLAGAVFSMTQADRFITDLTVVGFVLVLFFLIGLRIESTQGMLRDLTSLVETRSGGIDLDAAQARIGTLDAAVARTLGRAGELQALLRSEDLNIEKAYANRERSFQGLLENLSVERAAVTTNAEKMRIAMESTHQNLSGDLDAASRRFTELMNETSTALVSRIEEQLQKQSAEAIEICVKRLRASLDGVLIRAVEQVDARGATLAALISSKSEEFDERLLNFKKEVGLSLNGQIDDTQKAASIRIEAMAGCINRLLDRMNSGIAERSESLNQMLATRVLEIASTLKHGKTEMLHTIESATALSSDMTMKSDAANELLQQQIRRLNENVVSPLGSLVDSLKERGTSLSLDLADQFDRVNSALKAQSNDLSELFDQHIARLRDTLVASSDAVEAALEDTGASYQASLETLFRRHHQPISDEMASVRSEFAAQRKLLAPLVNNLGRVDRPAATLPQQSGYAQERRISPVGSSRATSSGRELSSRDEDAPSAMVTRRSIESETPRREAPSARDFETRDPVSRDVTRREVTSRDLGSRDRNRDSSTRDSSQRDLGQRDLPAGDRDVSSRDAIGRTSRDIASRERDAGSRDVAARETSAQDAGGKAGQSWLTDILARASSADEAAAPAIEEDDVGEANIFSAISTNIETLVSSERTAAAWAGYKRNETPQFHKIYTAQGGVVFDKLTALLEADEDLRASVVGYASNFETLLKDRFNDGDDRALLRFLSTPTGKVYTMLAHASNRLA